MPQVGFVNPLSQNSQGFYLSEFGGARYYLFERSFGHFSGAASFGLIGCVNKVPSVIS